MKIIKNVKLNNDKERAFDAIVKVLLESKGLSLEDFQKNRSLLVNLDDSEGGDYSFDFVKFREGEIGERIVIKQIAQVIFGEPTDPRLLTVPVRKLLEAVAPVQKENTEVVVNPSKTIEQEESVETETTVKPPVYFSSKEAVRKQNPPNFKLDK